MNSWSAHSGPTVVFGLFSVSSSLQAGLWDLEYALLRWPGRQQHTGVPSLLKIVFREFNDLLYASHPNDNAVLSTGHGEGSKLSLKTTFCGGKRERTKMCSRAQILFLSRAVFFIWFYESVFTCARTGEQRLLVGTLAWRHLERSRDVILTAGHILNNDNRHLL